MFQLFNFPQYHAHFVPHLGQDNQLGFGLCFIYPRAMLGTHPVSPFHKRSTCVKCYVRGRGDISASISNRGPRDLRRVPDISVCNAAMDEDVEAFHERKIKENRKTLDWRVYLWRSPFESVLFFWGGGPPQNGCFAVGLAKFSTLGCVWFSVWAFGEVNLLHCFWTGPSQPSSTQ